ncbi:sugar fermentation stimulation protein SfsA [Alicyclobacillus contaminans]|uniref:DNA/RNA nuclease SfsA n=1 Tax=Alicyclobacillus contaminans TaxID=392016 RepID=UPI0003FEF62E|nr:DNA/RNA nuclease SfsA [Alicyclobacillus contaminans]GMA51357.1 sugar fermentation stimulation protein SfsA [Alicyclobacillus contaminans]
MHYNGIVYGTLLKRHNRFLARVRMEDEEVWAHVKNTGRLRELFVAGARVALEPARHADRKTNFSIIAVQSGDTWVNVDAAAPHRLVGDAIAAGQLTAFGHPAVVQREVRYRRSRFDIQYETGDFRGFIEVKGVTLVEEGTAKFPDAPTERGTRHLLELADARAEGFDAAVFFLIQRPDAHAFAPHWQSDPDFAHTLANVAKQGVRVLAYTCTVKPDELCLGEPVPVNLTPPADEAP